MSEKIENKVEEKEEIRTEKIRLKKEETVQLKFIAGELNEALNFLNKADFNFRAKNLAKNSFISELGAKYNLNYPIKVSDDLEEIEGKKKEEKKEEK